MVAAAGEEAFAPVEAPAERGSADFQAWEGGLEVLRGRFVEFEELLLGAAPGARVRAPAPVRGVEVRFVPDFPVFDAKLVRPFDVARRRRGVRAPAPALVVVADDVLADARPLGVVLRRHRAVFLRAVLDGLPEAEEDLRSGAAYVVEVVVREDEVVAGGVVFVGVEVGEDGGNVAGMRAAGDAVHGIMRARKRDAGGAVFLEIAAQLVAARLLDGGAVVHGMHGLHGADGNAGINGDIHGFHGRLSFGLVAGNSTWACPSLQHSRRGSPLQESNLRTPRSSDDFMARRRAADVFAPPSGAGR